MARSAWYIWLHPRRSRDAMESLEEEVASLKEDLERTESSRADIEDELQQKTERTDTIIQRADAERDSLKMRIATLEGEKEDLKAEIREWEQTRIELDAIAEQLKEWEQVKARYKERIKMLTLRLRDARGRKGDFGGYKVEESASDILEDGESFYLPGHAPIDMLADNIADSLQSTPDAPHEIDDDSDAAGAAGAACEPEGSSAGNSAPSAQTSSARGTAIHPGNSVPSPQSSATSRRATSSSQRRRLPKNDADWLMTLPPE
ncbi:MAG: hypothetical protein K2K29_05810 [Muribaculaceae bacterium]|nr:hypothetical protein [Muribaculaceae bacterium]